MKGPRIWELTESMTLAEELAVRQEWLRLIGASTRAKSAKRTRPHVTMRVARRARSALAERRPRTRRTRRSGSRAGPSDSDGPEPARLPRSVARYLTATGLGLDQIRWCKRCRIVAPAIDAHQNGKLDRLGFLHGLCPRCRRRGGR